MDIYVLVAFLLIVSVWDMRTFEIPDAFLLVGGLAGFALAFYANGWDGLWSSFIAFAIVFLLTFLIWVIGDSFFGQSIIGAGDMRLFAVIAIFLGVTQTLIVFYWSIILAAFLFVCMIHPTQIIGLFRSIYHFFVYAIPKTPVSGKKLAFSVPITLTTILMQFV